MRAVDTNVLVRYLVADDARQFRQARRVIESGRVYVAKSVLLETAWVLRRAYARDAAQVLSVLEGLAAAREVELEDRPAVLKAIEAARAGLEFADALHVASKGPAAQFVTFDRRLVAGARTARIGGVVHAG